MKLKRLINNLKKLKANKSEFQDLFDVIVELLTAFLSETFFKGVNNLSDLPAHNLNRHFFSHSISNEPNYCRENCLKLLNIIDSFLALDFILYIAQ